MLKRKYYTLRVDVV